jgi:DNA-binding response OmpR family regulator
MENKKQKILMIDEDKFLRKVYRDKFSREGFEFLEATTGVEGLNKIFFEKPDLVILDLILPGKTGFDVLIEAKMKKETKDIPIIILSNLGQESDVKRGLELGAIDYLIKSEVSLSEVVKKVKESILKLNK